MTRKYLLRKIVKEIDKFASFNFIRKKHNYRIFKGKVSKGKKQAKKLNMQKCAIKA